MLFRTFFLDGRFGFHLLRCRFACVRLYLCASVTYISAQPRALPGSQYIFAPRSSLLASTRPRVPRYGCEVGHQGLPWYGVKRGAASSAGGVGVFDLGAVGLAVIQAAKSAGSIDTNPAKFQVVRKMRHPHPGFPIFARVDDVCGPCQGFDSDLPLPGSAADLALHAKEDKERRRREARLREAQSFYPQASSCLAALAAIMFVAAASSQWRRRR